MKINKETLRQAFNGTFTNMVNVLKSHGAEIVEGVYVTPGMQVTATGLKNKSFTIAPQGSGPQARRVRGSISLYRPDGTLTFIRKPAYAGRGGQVQLFFQGQPVLGYSE